MKNKSLILCCFIIPTFTYAEKDIANRGSLDLSIPEMTVDITNTDNSVVFKDGAEGPLDNLKWKKTYMDLVREKDRARRIFLSEQKKGIFRHPDAEDSIEDLIDDASK